VCTLPAMCSTVLSVLTAVGVRSLGVGRTCIDSAPTSRMWWSISSECTVLLLDVQYEQATRPSHALAAKLTKGGSGLGRGLPSLLAYDPRVSVFVVKLSSRYDTVADDRRQQVWFLLACHEINVV
jgi:hypothetical protein